MEEAHSKLKTFFREQQNEKQEEHGGVSQPQLGQVEEVSTKLEEEMETLKVNNSKLTDEANTLQAQLMKQDEHFALKVKLLESEKVAAELKFAELLKKAKKLQVELKGWREKEASRGSLEDAMKSLNEEKDAMTAQMASLRDQLESVELDHKSQEDILKKELDEAKSKCVESERNLDESLGQEETLNEELKKAKSKCAGLEEGLATSLSDKEKLREEMQLLQLRCSNLEQSLITSQAMVGTVRAELESGVSQMETSLANSVKTEDALREELAQLVSKSTQWDAMKTKMEAQIVEIESSLADAVTREEDLREEVALVKSKSTQLEQVILNQEQAAVSDVELSALKSKVPELEKALQHERLEKETLSESNGELRETTLLAQRRADELTEECQRLSIELHEAREKSDRVFSELTDTKEKFGQSCADLDGCNTEMVDTRTRLTGMESRVLELESDLKKALSALEDSKLKMDELEHARQSDEEKLRCELDGARSHGSELEDKMRLNEECAKKQALELEQSLQASEERLRASHKEVVSLQAAMEMRSQERETNHRRLDSMKSEVAGLQEKLDILENKDSVCGNQFDGKMDDSNSEVQIQMLSLQEKNDQLSVEFEKLKENDIEKMEALKRERDEAKAELEKRREVMVEQAQDTSSREKEVSSLKDENKKLKAFALKLKKELSDTRENVRVHRIRRVSCKHV